MSVQLKWAMAAKGRQLRSNFTTKVIMIFSKIITCASVHIGSHDRAVIVFVSLLKLVLPSEKSTGSHQEVSFSFKNTHAYTLGNKLLKERDFIIFLPLPREKYIVALLCAQSNNTSCSTHLGLFLLCHKLARVAVMAGYKISGIMPFCGNKKVKGSDLSYKYAQFTCTGCIILLVTVVFKVLHSGTECG